MWVWFSKALATLIKNNGNSKRDNISHTLHGDILWNFLKCHTFFDHLRVLLNPYGCKHCEAYLHWRLHICSYIPAIRGCSVALRRRKFRWWDHGSLRLPRSTVMRRLSPVRLQAHRRVLNTVYFSAVQIVRSQTPKFLIVLN